MGRLAMPAVLGVMRDLVCLIFRTGPHVAGYVGLAITIFISIEL